MKNPILIALTSALVTGAALLARPAFAEAPTTANVNTAVVHTADLDLDSQAGRQRLERRLAAAATEVCGTASDFDLAGKNEVRRCRDETLAEARSRSDRIVAAAATGAPIAVSAAR